MVSPNESLAQAIQDVIALIDHSSTSTFAHLCKVTGVSVEDKVVDLQKQLGHLHHLQVYLSTSSNACSIELANQEDYAMQIEPDTQGDLEKQCKAKAQSLLQEAEFEVWCSANNVDPFSANQCDLEAFLAQKDFPTWSDFDPPEYPGLNAFAAYMSFEEVKRGNYFDSLSRSQQHYAYEMLNTRYAHARNAGQFDIGKLISGRWKIIAALVGVEGSFNRGIYLVKDECDESGERKGILKLLPTEALNPQYSRREIDVQAPLKHPNIVELYHCVKGDHRHDTPYTVTEYCDKKTLGDLVRLYKAKKQFIPELYIWQILISLARAVQYCHKGPASGERWDSITHRDVILHNIFIKTSVRKLRDNYPYIVKLGDWGCGVTQSEWDQRNLTVDDLPCVDPYYNPPETALPTEATDIYQIGVVLWCLFCLKETPSHDLSKLAHEHGGSGAAGYSTDLQDLIFTLVNPVAEERPGPDELINSVLRSRATLRAKGCLPHIELLIADSA